MPNQFSFTIEPVRGVIYNRCVDCDEYPWGVTVSRVEQRQHWLKHEKERKAAATKARKASLKKARSVRDQQRRENDAAYS